MDDVIIFERKSISEVVQKQIQKPIETHHERFERHRKNIQKEIDRLADFTERMEKVYSETDMSGFGSIWKEKNGMEVFGEEKIYSLSENSMKKLLLYHSYPSQTILNIFATFPTMKSILDNGMSLIGYIPDHFEERKQMIEEYADRKEILGDEIPDISLVDEVDFPQSDLVIGTIPIPIFPKDKRLTDELLYRYYSDYLDNLSNVIQKSYESLKDNSFLILHVRDVFVGFRYLSIQYDLMNRLNLTRKIKYTLVLDAEEGISNSNSQSSARFKYFSEQTFRITHQYVICIAKGEGRLR